MITLRGTYADECDGSLPDRELQFVCRVMPAICTQTRKIVWVNGVGEEIIIQDEDVLQQCLLHTLQLHYGLSCQYIAGQ